jgi:2-dehydro-3-deoxy-D-arabinonate dehydratase
MAEVVRYVGADGAVRVGVRDNGEVRRLGVDTVADLLGGDLDRLAALVAEGGPVERDEIRLLAPVDGATEVWAAGVTYLRSREARVEESTEADVYQRVYVADRPEIFFKSVAWRVSGPGEPVAIRADSTVDVPEPELAVVVTASGEIAGYTICNDMSSRTIEGENPLYLPQAKMYAGACALGPSMTLRSPDLDPRALTVALQIRRAGPVAWHGQTSTAQLARSLDDLVGWLYAEQHFPAGAVLSTGTGIVPDLPFTLEEGDEVTITVDGLGVLANPVVRGKAAMAWQSPDPPIGDGAARSTDWDAGAA